MISQYWEQEPEIPTCARSPSYLYSQVKALFSNLDRTSLMPFVGWANIGFNGTPRRQNHSLPQEVFQSRKTMLGHHRANIVWFRNILPSSKATPVTTKKFMYCTYPEWVCSVLAALPVRVPEYKGRWRHSSGTHCNTDETASKIGLVKDWFLVFVCILSINAQVEVWELCEAR